MHEPNVYNVSAPESHLGFAKVSYDDPQVDSALRHIIDDHPFNSKVSVLMPASALDAIGLKSTFTEDKDFYQVKNMPLSEFCTPVFLQAFLNAGKVYAVSCDSRLDLDNVAALTPDGWLILLLDKLTYSDLRLSGKVSAHILRRPKERYVVKVNLKENFTPGNPYYKKVVNAFKEVPLKFTFWINWLPDGTDVCPSSIAKYFSDLGYEICQHDVQTNWLGMANIEVPVLHRTADLDSGTDVEVEPENLLEWIGCISLGITLGRITSYQSNLITPKPNIKVREVQVIEATGFFLPSHIHLLIDRIRSIQENYAEEMFPWASMTVYGHVDSPVTWGLTENSYYTNGDNFYTLIITRTGVWIYRVSGARKPLRMFDKCNNNK